MEENSSYVCLVGYNSLVGLSFFYEKQLPKVQPKTPSTRIRLETWYSSEMYVLQRIKMEISLYSLYFKLQVVLGFLNL
jgi:hypothetical protein